MGTVIVKVTRVMERYVAVEDCSIPEAKMSVLEDMRYINIAMDNDDVVENSVEAVAYYEEGNYPKCPYCGGELKPLDYDSKYNWECKECEETCFQYEVEE